LKFLLWLLKQKALLFDITIISKYNVIPLCNRVTGGKTYHGFLSIGKTSESYISGIPSKMRIFRFNVKQ